MYPRRPSDFLWTNKNLQDWRGFLWTEADLWFSYRPKKTFMSRMGRRRSRGRLWTEEDQQVFYGPTKLSGLLRMLEDYEVLFGSWKNRRSSKDSRRPTSILWPKKIFLVFYGPVRSSMDFSRPSGLLEGLQVLHGQRRRLQVFYGPKKTSGIPWTEKDLWL